MSECEYFSRCPIWAAVSVSVRTVWMNNYCRGARRERCARLQLLRSGKRVADDLLPNGTRMLQKSD